MLTKLVFIGIIEVILLGFGAAAIWFVEIGAIWFVKIGWYKLKNAIRPPTCEDPGEPQG